MDDVKEKVDDFISNLKHKTRVHSSYEVAKRTVQLLRNIVSTLKYSSAKELVEKVREIGRDLVAAQPSEGTIGNMVRRVLKIIREEHATCCGKADEVESQPSMLLTAPGVEDLSKPAPHLKVSIIEAIGELLDELDGSAGNIAAQAIEHIHANEVIMTAGYSKTVEAFLKGAARKRKFHVIVAESAPSYQGQELAKSLSRDSIDTTVITDSAVFAMMSRVNKVIIGTHTVLADGGLKALNGSHAISIAAAHHSVPVIVCAAMFKLSPVYPCSYDQDTLNMIVGPQDILKYSQGDLISRVQVQNPVFDYVPPDLITLFISNISGNAPSYVYRLLSELYDPEDHEL